VTAASGRSGSGLESADHAEGWAADGVPTEAPAQVAGAALPWRSLFFCLPLLLAPLLVWWLAFFPALSTADSVNSWNQIRTGHWDSHHPPPFTGLFWLFTRFTDSPWVMSLAQSIAMAAALAVFAVILSRRFSAGWWPVVAAFALVALPWLGPFTQEIWKDVPSAVALVVLSAALILATSDTGDRPGLPAWGWTAVVAAAALSAGLLRWNGAGTVVVAGVLAAPALSRGLRVRGVLACVFGGLLGFGVIMGLPSVSAVKPIPSVERHATFYADLANVARTNSHDLTPSDVAALEAVAPLADWAHAGRKCFWINDSYYRFIARHDARAVESANPALMTTWYQLLGTHPLDIVRPRVCRASAALPWIPPQHRGYRTFTVVTQQALTPGAKPPLPWLHALGSRALSYFTMAPMVWGAWMPAWWFLLFGAAAAFRWRGLGRRLLVLCLAVPVGTVVSYVVSAQSNDARYNLPAIIILLPLTAAVVGRRAGPPPGT